MKVDLTYFKDTGKYYSSGSYTTDLQKLFEIFREVRAMVNEGRLPGLCAGAKFNTLIDVPEHEHNHPHIIMVEDSKDKIGSLFQVGEKVHDDLTRTECKVVGNENTSKEVLRQYEQEAYKRFRTQFAKTVEQKLVQYNKIMNKICDGLKKIGL